MLKSILAGASEAAEAGERVVLETGLEVVEEGLRVGDDLRIDFLARDATGAPVLILTVDREDEAWAPMRLIDVDIWFAGNAFLLERGMRRLETRGPGLRWTLGHRVFVVTLGVSSSFYRRLQALGGIDLEVWELRSMFLRGETLWFAQGIGPWVADRGVEVGSAPDGIEDPRLAAIVERLIDRLLNVSPDLELRGDRFSREVLADGNSIVRVELADRKVWARIGASESPIELRGASDVDHVLDALLRDLLGEVPGSLPGCVRSPHPEWKLTDEEMAAFMKT